ncbi:hypothetical protein [Pseudoteredinibacter isoporae]|uniref:DUF5666 domain-containing protein n=1 Tax=Pseudoteredinibacter isoporae TaxID=570281 RepID=A0A7X0JYJ9_9GAMM|nr:hypothetical protein [Pseudoteredinibacter isoporae]MBB6523826.1 hypothetical protein [Pseudoteredinibacter isoporae]NHO89346.1 hypothetical protein [Pseudoteredinibacter isoporae]NIB22453.1 hypothetical protein [Pseudoteredinibacter isoporae]
MRILTLFCSLMLIVSMVSVLAQSYDEHGSVQLVGVLRGTIDYVHHDKKQLVIDDRRLTMPLNFKVSDVRGKSSNRFALKTGQNVEFFARYEKSSNTFYVDWLKLLD